MICKSLDVLAVSLESLLKTIDESCKYLVNIGQPIGLCIVSPKRGFIDRPTKEIQNKIEQQAVEYFKGTNVELWLYRYFDPPLVLLTEDNQLQKKDSIDDFQVSFYHPRFDEQWKQTEIARSLIYCPGDPIAHEWSDLFEQQLEAIRLTPILDQYLKECQIIRNINSKLSLPAETIFESFVYEYATNDLNFPEMLRTEKEIWKTRKIDWKIRYRLAVDVIKSANTLYELYIIARKKAASIRNPILKPLFWAFTDYVEYNLVQLTNLPEEKKKQFIFQLRQTKKRESKGKYIAKRRPTLCISDVECAQVLNSMIEDFLIPEKRTMALAEAIIFIWIAQHGAFSGLHLTLDSILSITFADFNFQDFTICINNQEIHLTDRLNRILSDWIGDVSNEQQRLFENITYDSLEDIISNVSIKLYGIQGRLSPRDFLEKVHVIPGVRISLELRRQITAQERLVKKSSYRIDTRVIKKKIKEAVRNRSVAGL